MSLHKPILLILFAGLLLAVYGYTRSVDAGIAAGFFAFLLVAIVALEVFVWRPLRDVAGSAAELAGKSSRSVVADHAIGGLAQDLEAIRALLRDYERQLSHADDQLQQSQTLLRESEERYALAVRGANDGLVEWNLKTDDAYFSPRWKGMLGFAEDEISERIDNWRDRIHPDDREHTLAELRTHLDGRTPRFDNEHRLRHKDGSWRWVLARGCAVRTASGKPYRLLALHTDITSRKQVQEALLEVADGLEAIGGEECFRALTKNFASALGVREAFVCECVDYPTTRVRILAWWVDQHFGQNEEFDLTGTACEDIIVQGKFRYYAKGVGELFPLERLYNRDGYLGIPIFSSAGAVIGHIACMHNLPMREELPHLALLKIFAARAGIELERRLLAASAMSRAA